MSNHDRRLILREGYNGPPPINRQIELPSFNGVDHRAENERGNNGPPPSQSSEPRMPPPPPPKKD